MAARKPRNAEDNSTPGEVVENSLRIYYDALRILWKRLIRNDWRAMKEEPYILESLTSNLREVIYNLEGLRARHSENRVNLEAVLDAASNALQLLYVAADIAPAQDAERVQLFYQDIAQSRRYLESAVAEFPAELQTADRQP